MADEHARPYDIDKLLEALGETFFLPSRVTWLACCPACPVGDRYFGLKIIQHDDHVQLLTSCSCTPAEVLAAVGMTWEDVYPDRWVAARWAAMAWRLGEDGRPRRKRHRFTPDLNQELAFLKRASAYIREGNALSADNRANSEIAMRRVKASMKGKK